MIGLLVPPHPPGCPVGSAYYGDWGVNSCVQTSL